MLDISIQLRDFEFLLLMHGLSTNFIIILNNLKS